MGKADFSVSFGSNREGLRFLVFNKLRLQSVPGHSMLKM
jgi:hypothetical protein